MEHTFSSLKKIYREKLAGLYPIREIDSLLFLVIEKLGNQSRLNCIANPDTKISISVYDQLLEVAKRLQTHEPVQYILGETEFFGLPFAVAPAVLIPRPETEELVQWIGSEFENKKIELLDIGTGSGCIAVTLAKYLPFSTVHALDISEDALKIALFNARQNQADVIFHKADILNMDESVFENTFDVVVSNPPYICESEKKWMRPNVLAFEPATALFVTDADPLIFYRVIAHRAKQWLKKPGSLYFELNERFEPELMQLLEKAGYTEIEPKHDFQGKPRMLKALNR